MKFITNYLEFGTDESKNLINYVSEKEITSKSAILDYLRSDKYYDGVQCSTICDFVNNTQTHLGTNIYTDVEFFWDDKETYHFEKYNLKLNDDFIQHVLDQQS